MNLGRLVDGEWWWFEEQIDSYGIWIWKCLHEVVCLITSLKNRCKNCLFPLDHCVVLILSRIETQGALRDMVSVFIRIHPWLTLLEFTGLGYWQRLGCCSWRNCIFMGCLRWYLPQSFVCAWRRKWPYHKCHLGSWWKIYCYRLKSLWCSRLTSDRFSQFAWLKHLLLRSLDSGQYGQ